MDSFFAPVSGLVTFDSLPDLRLYVRQLLAYYERQFDTYSQNVGTMLRAFEKAEKGRERRRLAEDNWQKVGRLLVNNRDPMLGTLEVMLEAMEEFKVKKTRTNEVLIGFDSLEPYQSSEGSPVSLQLKNGVPIRIILDAPKLQWEVPLKSETSEQPVFLSQ